MPTVPSSFVPEISSQGNEGMVPFQAPPVEGVRNALPEQQIRFGQASEQLGNTMFSIANQLQDSVDESVAKAGDVQNLKNSNEILYGQNGYFNTTGKDAVTNYQQTSDQLDASISSVMDGMSNETQKQMFAGVAARHRVSVQAQMLAHRSKNITEFDKNETASRIDAYVSDAINKFDDPKGRAIATGHVENQIEQLGSLNGIPANSEQMKSMRQKYMDGIHTGIVGRFSNQGNYVSASNYVAEQDKLGKIDSKTRERLIDFIDTNQKRIGSIDVASKIIAFGNSNSFVMGGYSDIVNPSFSKNVDDLGPQQNAGLKVVYAVNSDQPISSPQDGIVQTIKKQDNGYEVSIQMADGKMVKISGISVVSPENTLGKNRFSNQRGLNIGVGQPIKAGEVIGNTENYLDGSTTEITYQVFSSDGTEINPLAVNSQIKGEDPIGSVAPKTRQAALYMANGIENKDFREQVKSQIDKQWAEKEYATNQDTEKNKLAALKWITDPKNSLRTIPISIQMQLEENAPGFLGTLEKAQSITDDSSEMLDAVLNPLKYDPSYVVGDDRLSNGSKIALINKWNNADLMQDSTIVSKSLQQSLVDNNLNDIAFPQDSNDKAGNTERALGIWTDVNTRIRAKQQEDRKKLNPEEVQKIIDDVILDTAKKTGSSFWHGNWNGGWRSELEPISSMTEEEKASAVIDFNGKEVKIEDVKSGASMYYFSQNSLPPSANELRRVMNTLPSKTDPKLSKIVDAIKERLSNAGITNPTPAQELNAYRSLLADLALSKKTEGK